MRYKICAIVCRTNCWPPPVPVKADETVIYDGIGHHLHNLFEIGIIHPAMKKTGWIVCIMESHNANAAHSSFYAISAIITMYTEVTS